MTNTRFRQFLQYPIILRHLLFWTIFCGTQYLVDSLWRLESTFFFTVYLSSIIYFYSCVILIYQILYSGKRFKNSFFLLIIALIYIIINFYIKKNEDINLYLKDEKLAKFWLMDIFSILIKHFLMAFIYANYIFIQSTHKKLLKLEIEKHNLTMNYLKTQIDIHFFFNSLNLLEFKARSLSQELSDKIISFSEVLRNALNNDKV